MFVMLSHEVGSLIISDRVITCPRCIELDGRTIRREDYPELFKARRIDCDTVRMMDTRGRIMGANIWVIAKPIPAGCFPTSQSCCLRDGVAPMKQV